MRKLLTGAVIASATLALTGVAIAQVSNQAGDTTFDATLSPKKVGTKNKPKSHELRAQLTVNRPGTTVETITLKLGKGFKFSGKGFKKCTVETLEDVRSVRVPRRLEGRSRRYRRRAPRAGRWRAPVRHLAVRR